MKGLAVDTLHHLLILPHNLLAAYKSQFMVLQLVGSDVIGAVLAVVGVA